MTSSRTNKRSRPSEALRVLLLACLLWGISYAHARLGVAFGERWIPPGEGYVNDTGVVADLFRFDSGQYYSTARAGYSYNGDPDSGPNLVFGPLFPLTAVGWSDLTGMDLVSAGFWVNEIALFLALVTLTSVLRRWIGWGAAFAVLLASSVAAGSYAYHAYYSESITLFCLAACLWFYVRRQWTRLALSCALLGACRLATVALVAVVAAALLLQAIRSRQTREILRFVFLAALSFAGTLSYLGYIAWKWGNPLRLLTDIQSASWSAFHRPTSLPDLLTGKYMWSYWAMAFGRGGIW